MKHAGIPFREINITLRMPETKAQILRYSPAGKVPTLIARGQAIWDSLAILEYLAEAHPEAKLWPERPEVRAHARSLAAEMHSGFAPLREHCPMDLVRRLPKASLPDKVSADVRRIVDLWRDCRGKYSAGGKFLFGAFSAADAMYAPVASRFRTYLPDLKPYGDDGTAQAYVDTIFALPVMAEWEAAAKLDPKPG
jgi:glutathione S-transferase